MAKFEVVAEMRDLQGKGASRRLRRSGKVPAVMYGAGKDVAVLTLDHDKIMHQMHNEAFASSILDIKVGSKTEQAVLRDVQMHPFKPRVQHMDFQRISATEKIHMRVPFHFVGADIAPGVKLHGGLVSHLIAEADVTCLPKDLPEFITVDLSEVGLNQSVHLSDIKLPEGVQFLAMSHGNDLGVASINPPRAVEEEAPVAAAASAEGAAAAAPAAEAGKAAPAAAPGKGAAPAKPEAGKK